MRCLAIDMDGTLLNSRRELSPVNRAALREAAEQGWTIVLATGRSIRSVRPYVEELGLPIPVVANNGAQNWLELGTRLSEYVLNPGRVRQMRDLALEPGADVRYWGHGLEASYYSDRGPHPFPPVESVSWLSFAMETRNPNLLAVMTREIEGWPEVEVSRAAPTQVEITARGITKATGLREVCERRGILPSEVAAIGDGMNDVAMLRMAGLAVAMANAEDGVKAVCKWVAPSNDDDGVAWLIHRLLNGLGAH